MKKITTMKPPRSCSLLLFLLFICFFPFFNEMGVLAQNNGSNGKTNVGVILDMKNWIGKMGLSSISMALSDFYASHEHYQTRLVLHARDSNDDVVAAAAAALDLLKNVEVEAIIGPLTSMEAEFVVNLGEKARVPIISFSATSAFLSPIRSPYFVRATQNDSAQVKAISSIIQAFGWREIVPIYEASEFGEGIIPFLADALVSIDARIPYRSVISRVATDDQIVAELYKLRTMQTRVFVVHMNPSLASRLFINAEKVGMMEEGYVWIATDAVANTLSSMDNLAIHSMQGVLGVKSYVPTTERLASFTVRWKTKYQQENPTELNVNLNVFGLWAYDAATALAMAVEKASERGNIFQKPNISATSPTELDRIGVSLNGPKLLQALLDTRFTGLGGEFRIIDGQLQSSAYQIINVIGDGGRGVGYWTADNGIVKELPIPSTSSYSTSHANLKPIFWPGDITSHPKGWVIPAEGKKLRIAVPVKLGFSRFMHAKTDPKTSKTIATGYCIDVFDAVMRALPYYIPYEYVSYAPNDSTKPGYYNDMVYSVFRGDFDAAVGDITIVANRSRFVDFSLPYTESGVSMVVKTRNDKSKNAWIFLEPLSWRLWLTSFWSFFFIGFVVWVLEHRINEDFRGPPSHQAGTVFWFSFSTMVFAQREKVLSNLARFVMIIWFFVVLILTQSYTASLTSLFTVRRLVADFTSLDELRIKGENIGYQEGSFVYDNLKQMNFDDSHLKMFRSEGDLDAFFSNGTKHGGIAAAFDEVPYMKLFVAQNCSEYKILTSTNKTAGFGFAFPIGSPLVRDISEAVLRVTEGPEMIEIEKRWIQNSTCPESNTSINPNPYNLDLDSFWGLFLIAGAASFSALALYTIMFVYEHKQVFTHFDRTASLWRKIKALFGHFNEKDLTSHTFRRIERRETSGIENREGLGSVQASPHAGNPPSPSIFSLQNSPNTNFPPSPFSPSQRTDRHSVSFDASAVSHGPTAQEVKMEIELPSTSQDTPPMPELKNDNHGV